MEVTGPTKSQSPALAIGFASLVSALEWYDLVIFGFLGVIVAGQFFPAEDPTTSILLTFATFGVAFILRPLGGLFFGIYTDRAGRARALWLAAVLMMIGTGAIAILPTYSAVGLWASVGVVIARLIQGFSAGGGFASSTALLIEQSDRHRGFFGSWQIASQGLTTVLAAGASAALVHFFSQDEIDGGAWRIPFLFGLLIGPLSVLMIRLVPEPAEFMTSERSETPLRETLAVHRFDLLVGIGITVLANVCSFFLLYVPTWAVSQLGMSTKMAFVAIMVAGAIQLILSPVFGHLGDRVGRVTIMKVASLAILVSIVPGCTWLVSAPSAFSLLVVQAVFGLLHTAYFSSQPALVSELFPVRTRGTGVSLAYNASVTVFGGFAPFIMTALIALSGNKAAPSYYVMAAASISFITLLVAGSRGNSQADGRV